MRYVVLVPVIFLLALLQASMLPSLRLLSLTPPNLLLVLVVAWAMVRGPGDTITLVALAGLFLGLLSPQPLGLAILALTPVLPLALVRDLQVFEVNFLISVPVLIVSNVLYFCVMLLGLTVLGESVAVGPVLRAMLPAVVSNLLALAPVYALVSRLAPAPRRESPAWGRGIGIRA